MSDVFSKIWLEYTVAPALRFRLSARIKLGSRVHDGEAVIAWLDETSLKLIERGPFVRAEERDDDRR